MDEKYKKQLRFLGLTAGAAAVSAVSSYMTANYMMRVALDRNVPKAPKGVERIIAGGKIERDFLEAMEKASEKLAAEDSETVKISAHDGITVVGHIVRADRPKRILIAMHGWRSSWHRDFGLISDFFCDSGCTVLYAEQRGQGESGGESMGFGLTERYDCRDWANYVAERFGKNIPIYLCGVSMGAATVMMASELDMPENVSGILADCGFTSPDEIWRHVMNNNMHIHYSGLMEAVANEICRKKTEFGASDISTVDALKKTGIPVFFAHGTDDTFVPVTMTYENYKACAAPKKLLIVPGADHGMSYYVEKENYERALREFWDEIESSPADSHWSRYGEW